MSTQTQRVAAILDWDAREHRAERIARARHVLAMSDEDLGRDFADTDERFHRGHQAWGRATGPDPLPPFRERVARARYWSRLTLALAAGDQGEEDAKRLYEEERA